MESYSQAEQELRLAQLRADIENKQADTAYKAAAAKSEPWKVMAALLGGIAAVVAGVFGALGYMLGKGH